MDADRFDTMIRACARPPSRRALLGLGLAGGLGSLLARFDAGAKPKKCKRKQRRCRGTCIPRTNCCKDANCQAGEVCKKEKCVAKPECQQNADCDGGEVCQNGTCACPTGTESCGGECLPGCPASTPGRVVARHPGTCDCCVRPGSYPCPNHIQQCCDEPDSLPCCGPPCEPLAVDPYCPQPESCHHDAECYDGWYCPEGDDPRACTPIPG
jgi:hypothetical protein